MTVTGRTHQEAAIQEYHIFANYLRDKSAARRRPTNWGHQPSLWPGSASRRVPSSLFRCGLGSAVCEWTRDVRRCSAAQTATRLGSFLHLRLKLLCLSMAEPGLDLHPLRAYYSANQSVARSEVETPTLENSGDESKRFQCIVSIIERALGPEFHPCGPLTWRFIFYKRQYLSDETE